MPLWNVFRRARSGSPEELATFLYGQAAFVAQKTVLDYCRVKMGRNDTRYFADANFKAALEHCRWQVFFAAAADIMLLTEAMLRPLAAGREAALGLALVDMHATVLTRSPCPPGEGAAAAERLAAFAHLLQVRQDAAPAEPNRMPLLAEPVLFATLPVHAEQRAGESVAIRGALRFHVVSTEQEMRRHFDLASLAYRLSTSPDCTPNSL